MYNIIAMQVLPLTESVVCGGGGGGGSCGVVKEEAGCVAGKL